MASGKCLIQFRLPENQTLKHEFEATTTLREVNKFLRQGRHVRNPCTRLLHDWCRSSSSPSSISRHPHHPHTFYAPAPVFDLKCGPQAFAEADYSKSLSELRLCPRAALIVQTTHGCQQGTAGTFLPDLLRGGADGDLDIDDMSYEQLLELEKRLGQVKKPTASVDTVNELSSFVFVDKKAAASAEAAVSSSALPAVAGSDTMPPSASAASDSQISAASSSASDSTLPSAIPALVRQESLGPTRCGICLEDFAAGEELRALPCFQKHVYHMACVDYWLLEFKKTCPICLVPVEH
jgi:hypothetical protein